MMRRLTEAHVEGLFGYVTHDLTLRQDQPTILTGPNGVGKTHVLRLIRAMLGLDVRAIADVPFGAASLTFSDGRLLQVGRTPEEDGTTLKFKAKRWDQTWSPELEIRSLDGDDVDESLPPFIERLPDGQWYDARADRTVAQALLERRYNVVLGDTKKAQFADAPDVRACVKGLNAIFIDTRRLDARPERLGSLRDRVERERFDRRHPTSRIEQYIDQIRVQVVEARRASVDATQSADLSFASRALAAAHNRVQEAALRARYTSIVDRYEDLTSNGLATGEAPLDFPNNTTPTVRRILDVFLDDWERRLKPLLPVNTKMRVLRRILDEKFVTTGKRTRMTATGRLAFYGRDGLNVRVASLSSGEQHLVALYTLLLFAAAEQSVVLIDEPELSMHAAWKHAFLEDISEVATLADLQVIMATHSSAVVNGRWDLTEELAPAAEPIGEKALQRFLQDGDEAEGDE